MAVTLTALQLATALRQSAGAEPLEEPQKNIFERLLSAVTSLVQDYAPQAPENLQNEAAIRVGAWIFDAVPGRSQANAMDSSGARGLLAPYRIRRAFPVDGGDTPAGISPAGETATLDAITAAIEAHRAMSDAHHIPGADGITLVSSPENAVDQDYVTNSIVAAVEAHRALPETHHTRPNVPSGLAGALTMLMDAQTDHFGNESAHHEKTELPETTNVDAAIATHDELASAHTAEISRRVGQVATIVADQDTAHRELVAAQIAEEVANRNAAIAAIIISSGGGNVVAEQIVTGAAPIDLAFSGLKVTITPSTVAARILVDWSGSTFQQAGAAAFSPGVTVYRGGTDDSFVGATKIEERRFLHQSTGFLQGAFTPSGRVVDSPATTSPVTYRLWWKKPSAAGSFQASTLSPLVMVLREVA